MCFTFYMYLYSIYCNNRSQTQVKYQIKEGGTINTNYFGLYERNTRNKSSWIKSVGVLKKKKKILKRDVKDVTGPIS